MKNKKLNIIIVVLLCFVGLLVYLALSDQNNKPEELPKNEAYFELIGDKDIYVLVNGDYIDKKAYVFLDGTNYSNEVVASNSCDTSIIGDCSISYTSPKSEKVLVRNIHVSDFSEWFQLDYDSEKLQDDIEINIMIDRTKVDRYILPDGAEKYDNDVLKIEKNGKYTIQVYDKYDNVIDKVIEIKNIIIKPIEATCTAVAKQNTTEIIVDANKNIISYVYNGVTSTDDTYTFDKRIKENKVVLYDDDDQEKEILCKTTVEPYNSFGLYKHVFIIGIDGLGAAFGKVSTPNFDRIFGKYAYRHDAKTEYITISAQNWGSILTGVAYNTHGMTNGSIAANQRNSKSKNLSIFYYVRKAYPNANLASIVNWNPINNGIVENDINVTKKHGSSDNSVRDQVVDYLKSGKNPTLLYVHFDEVDHTAHTKGGYSSNYYNAVKEADSRMGEIYNTIESLGLMKDSLFIVVADHGECATGHGGRSKDEASAIVAVRGYTVNKTTLGSNTQNRDVAAITLYALGIKQPSHFVAKVPKELFGEPR